jgi:hypothetical protein
MITGGKWGEQMIIPQKNKTPRAKTRDVDPRAIVELANLWEAAYDRQYEFLRSPLFLEALIVLRTFPASTGLFHKSCVMISLRNNRR